MTYLLRELPISAREYSFGRSRIFIRSVSVLDQLEEWRRDRLEELVTLIQKIYRGWRARQSWSKVIIPYPVTQIILFPVSSCGSPRS